MRSGLVIYKFPSPTGGSAYEELKLGAKGTEIIHVPKFTASSLIEAKKEVIRNRDMYLANRPLDEIISVIDSVSRKWLDKNYELRKTAQKLLPLITGYSSEMVEFTIDYLASMFTKDELYRTLEVELGDPKYLDEFRPRKGVNVASKAYGPELITNVFAGNVPVLPVVSLTSGLLVKAAQLSKVASEEPLFPFLYQESLSEEDPNLAKTIAIGYWKGGDEEVERIAFDVPVLVAYGGPQSIRDIKRRVFPKTKFVPYGHKWSFGCIGREYLAKGRVEETARDCSLSASLYDQQGCLSPQLFWVEKGGEVSPKEFGEYLARAMEKTNQRFPRGKISIDTSGKIQQLRGYYEFKEQGGDAKVWSSKRTDWTVIYEKMTPHLNHHADLG